MIGHLLMLDAEIRYRLKYGRRRHWPVINWKAEATPLWFRLWLRLPCWLTHNWLHVDPLRDPREWWCSKCNRRERR